VGTLSDQSAPKAELISHELSHVLLGHPFTYPIDESGCRNVDRKLEEEASWLGPTILVSDEAALHVVRMGLDTDTACRMYQVSAPLLQMRLNASGARIRMRRAYF
jgi:Zn-dependent peptidase ImmA (M78 family)